MNYPHHCCCLRDGYGNRLSYGCCANGRDPDKCADCEEAKKRFVAARRKKRHAERAGSTKSYVRGNCSFRGGDEHEQKARWVIRERIKANAALLAAAMAACARESEKPLKEALEKIAQSTCSCLSSSDLNWHHERCNKFIALRALERAVGEKA